MRIVEVGPRDGLQNEAATVAVADRIAMVDALSAAGLPEIEAGSFVSPRWVPRMADTDQVLAGIVRRPGVRITVLVPNAHGLKQAIAAGADSIAVFASASERFSHANINCSITDSLDRYRPVVSGALAAGLRVRGYVSCVLGCPYQGEVAPAEVARVTTALHGMGCAEVSLGDTIGIGTPTAARAMLDEVARVVPIAALALHFHDTYGQALANILACLPTGIAVFDSAVGGLGGCPYARGATGNVATEDLVYMLHGMGHRTGVNLGAVVAAGAAINAKLGRRTASRVAAAWQG